MEQLAQWEIFNDSRFRGAFITPQNYKTYFPYTLPSDNSNIELRGDHMILGLSPDEEAKYIAATDKVSRVFYGMPQEQVMTSKGGQHLGTYFAQSSGYYHQYNDEDSRYSTGPDNLMNGPINGDTFDALRNKYGSITLPQRYGSQPEYTFYPREIDERKKVLMFLETNGCSTHESMDETYQFAEGIIAQSLGYSNYEMFCTLSSIEPHADASEEDKREIEKAKGHATEFYQLVQRFIDQAETKIRNSVLERKLGALSEFEMVFLTSNPSRFYEEFSSEFTNQEA